MTPYVRFSPAFTPCGASAVYLIDVFTTHTHTHTHTHTTRSTAADLTIAHANANDLFTFRVSRRRREMYCGHARLFVCVSACLCLSAAACPHYCAESDVTWGSGRGCPLVVHYWADMQSVHGLRCYGNITRTRNVSEYMLVLALCLPVVFYMLLTHFVIFFTICPQADIITVILFHFSGLLSAEKFRDFKRSVTPRYFELTLGPYFASQPAHSQCNICIPALLISHGTKSAECCANR